MATDPTTAKTASMILDQPQALVSRRRLLRRLVGAGATEALVTVAPSAALAGPDIGPAAGPVDPVLFLQGFLAAQQDRDLQRLRASFVSQHQMIWVHNGRCQRGERSFLAWLTTNWSGASWRVTPILAKAETTRAT